MTEQVTTETPVETPRGALSGEQVSSLMRDLNPDRVVELNKGKSGTLKYLEAWDVKASLIRVFGFANFSAEVIDSQIVNVVPKGDNQVVVLAKATVRLTIHATGAIYTESAAASQTGTQVGEVADFALKTAESDALKRCAIYLGSQFGLSLYRNGSTADVVRVVLDPAQKAAMEAHAVEVAAKRAAAEAQVQGALKTGAAGE